MITVSVGIKIRGEYFRTKVIAEESAGNRDLNVKITLSC